MNFKPNTMRERCFVGHEWPKRVSTALQRKANSQNIDEDKLQWMLRRATKEQYIVLTAVSKEYLKLVLPWLHFLKHFFVDQYLLLAVDSETAQFLRGERLPYAEVQLDPIIVDERNYFNEGGFGAKGAAIIHARTQYAYWFVSRGRNVIQCDLDAILVRNPYRFLSDQADIFFQRTKFHPDEVADVWGFTCCGGFVAFRGSSKVAEYLERVKEIQSFVSSDQISFNVALYELGVDWDAGFPGVGAPGEHRNWFKETSGRTFCGYARDLDLNIISLPSNIFWRHKFVKIDKLNVTLIHPNSPKEQAGKIREISTTLCKVDKHKEERFKEELLRLSPSEKNNRSTTLPE